MSGADVCARSHRRHVCGKRQNEARRRRTRPPPGATKTTTGACEEMIRETMVRVDSSSPPGVRRITTTRSAFERSASSITPVRYSAVIGWMIPSTSATTTVGRPVG